MGRTTPAAIGSGRNFLATRFPWARRLGFPGRANCSAVIWRSGPLPNHAPATNSDHANNYYSTIHLANPTDRYFARLDENINNNNRLNVSVSRSNLTLTVPAPFKHAGAAITQDTDWSGSVLYNWVISPTTIFDVHIGVGTTNLITNGVSGLGSLPDPSIDTTQWGFDSVDREQQRALHQRDTTSGNNLRLYPGGRLGV